VIDIQTDKLLKMHPGLHFIGIQASEDMKDVLESYAMNMKKYDELSKFQPEEQALDEEIEKINAEISSFTEDHANFEKQRHHFESDEMNNQEQKSVENVSNHKF
jgi:predicted  nucleic acid-binding Zn-ribbon protein